MKAILLLRTKATDIDGSTREIVIWELPNKTAHYPHGIKYRLYFGLINGICLVRYDNERHKGDHKHIRGKERPYQFITVAQLLEDFEIDIEKVKTGKLWQRKEKS